MGYVGSVLLMRYIHLGKEYVEGNVGQIPGMKVMYVFAGMGIIRLTETVGHCVESVNGIEMGNVFVEMSFILSMANVDSAKVMRCLIILQEHVK
jgi:hypothetical protein